MKFQYIKHILAVTLLLLLIAGCAPQRIDKKVITVSIPPLEGLVEQIVNNDYQVVSLLPSGSTPENYSPTPSQLINIEDSEFVFFVGTLEFENTIAQRLLGRDVNIVNTADGVELIEGQCSHNHRVGSEHNHGIDPHVWMSLVELEKVVGNIGRVICEAHPDSVRYKANTEQLIGNIQQSHRRYGELLGPHKGDAFLIYHPALTYFARDYGLEQISVEQEGKAPTPTALAELAAAVDKLEIKKLIYQAEYPLDVVKPVAEILDVTLLEINPLNVNILTEIDRIANTLLTPDYGAERVN